MWKLMGHWRWNIFGSIVRLRAYPNGPRLHRFYLSLTTYQPRNCYNHVLSFLSPPSTMEITKVPVHTVAWLEAMLHEQHFSQSTQKMIIDERIYWHVKGAALIHLL